MKIRVQPRYIDIPEGAPFKNDLLGREEPVQVLTELIGNIEGPCVLAVDAAWGTGKTTFINIWAQYLRDSQFPVVKFNAWDTDFSQDPFVALSVELTDGLSEYVDNPVRYQVADLAARANKLARRLFPTMAKIIGGTAPLLLSDMGPVPEQLIGQAIQSISAGNPSSTSELQPASYAEERLFEYQDTKKLVKEFRESFQTVANNLSQSNGNRPLIVFIDELDRCRPSYAIELLETAKHLFAVDHILFVLAVNRRELAHSIKGVYGGGFDAVGYLNRFIDLDYQLPDPDRNVFFQESLETVRVIQYLNPNPPKDTDGRREESGRGVRELQGK